MTTELRIEDESGVRWIELQRPESRNGLTEELVASMRDALAEVGDRADLRAVVLTGAGGHFCSGMDLKEAFKRGPKTPAESDAMIRDVFHGLIRTLRALDCPSLAVVDGDAAGFGCDLALACDLRLISSRARFGELFVRRGLIPDGGSTYHLPRLIGIGRALELVLTGRLVEADEALRIGLANRMVPAEELAAEGRQFARQLAAAAPIAVRLAKRSVYASYDGDLDDALDRERAGQLECLGSKDFVEGVASFLQKRPPTFRGE